ncbi:MAG: hypothetical protein ACKVXR_14490 [Planctomycetota bacterium]
MLCPLAVVVLAQACISPSGQAVEEPRPAGVAPVQEPARASGDVAPDDGRSFEESMMAAEPAPEKPGLPVGERAPAFTLEDQAGRKVSLESLIERGPVALVFFRSADW